MLVQAPLDYEIVEANEPLMAEVEGWLDAEEAVYQAACRRHEVEVPTRGFRCNWDSVKRAWYEGEATVHMLIVGGEAVGFLDGTDILEIRPDARGKGYGRILAEFMVKAEKARGISVAKIGIAPSEAEPFWVSMGFTPVKHRRGPGGGIFAYRILPKLFDNGGGPSVSYSVEFFPQDEWHADRSRPIASFEGNAEQLEDGTLQLPARAYCFNADGPHDGDYFVRVTVDGIILLGDKAKYEESRAIGVKKDADGTFFIDRIRPAEAPAA